MINIQPHTLSSQTPEKLNSLILELQAFEKQFDPSKSTSEKDIDQYRNELLKELSENEGELLLALDENELVGFIAWHIIREPEFLSPYAYMSDLIVTEKMRGQGIGNKLLETAIQNIKGLNINRIKIGVLVDNTATKSLYEKMGFKLYSLELQLKWDS